MKKLLTLALVLVMALGLAAPALAYTNNTATSTPYTGDIYLVDYSAGSALFAGGLSLSSPASNRGYARNEVVAAVASFTVPANANIMDIYQSVAFGGTNVSLNVTDNKIHVVGGNDVATLTDNVETRYATWTNGNYAWSSTDNEISKAFAPAPSASTIPVSTKIETYSFLFYGKVLDDVANMYIKLNHGAAFIPMGSWTTVMPAYLRSANTTSPSTGTFSNATVTGLSRFVVLSEDYVVYTTGANGVARTYYISDNASPTTAAAPKLLMHIEVNAKNQTEGVVLYDGATAAKGYRFFVTPSGDITIHDIAAGAPVVTNSATYNGLLATFNTIFDALGLTLTNRTNIMVDADWTAIANSVNIKETVAVEPWTPYVQIPDEPVVTPPKTGDAASILGFAIIAIAGVAAIVVRKVRA